VIVCAPLCAARFRYMKCCQLLKLRQRPCRRRGAWMSLPGCSGARRTLRTSGSTQASTRRSWTAFCMSCMSQSRQHQLPDHGTPDCEQASDRSPPQTWQSVAALAVRGKQQPPGNSPVGHGACVPTEHERQEVKSPPSSYGGTCSSGRRAWPARRPSASAPRCSTPRRGRTWGTALRRGARGRRQGPGPPSGPIQLLASARCQTCTYAFEPTSVAGKRRVSRVLGRAAR